MSYATFTAEQFAQVERADMQQSVVLRYWLRTKRDRNCRFSKLCRVFTSGNDSCRLCRYFGAWLEYSLDELSIRRRACAPALRPAVGRTH
jgi:hypothetical protein